MLNSVVLMGRLTADPELKTTPSNKSVTSFALAVDRGYAKPGEERQTDFIDVVAWNQTAEFITRYFKKGSMIAIEGTLQTGFYKDTSGNKRKAVEVKASNVSFCGSKAATPAPPQTETPTPTDNIDIEPDEDVPF